MQIIVQEGRAIVSLRFPIQAHDDALRTTSINEITDTVKAYYRDHELIRVEMKEGTIDVVPSAISGVFWIEKGRRYQLKVTGG
jgi:hypothetical protein